MSRLHAHDVHPESFKFTAHPGLWLDRFCPEIAICNQEGQKDHLVEICGLKPAANEYLSLRKRHEAACRYAEIVGLELSLTLRLRLAIHLSRASALDNAATCLHPIYGFAYLPGSGLKGLARAYASLLWSRHNDGVGNDLEGASSEEFKVRFLNIFGWAPSDERRGEVVKTAAGLDALRDPSFGGHDDNAPAQRGGVVFHDAWAETYPTLEVDVTTCHYPDYYKKPKENPPGDWQDPLPITFLALAPGVRFRFFVSGQNQEHVDQALKWLFGGLYWLGAGAKTAAGYGSFSWNEDEQRREQERVAAEKIAEAKRVEEANNRVIAKRQQERATEALQNIALTLKANEVLMVPVVSDATQPASRTGYHLILTDGVWSRGPACALGKNATSLAKGLVFKVIKKGTTNDRGQTEVQGPITPMLVPTPA